MFTVDEVVAKNIPQLQKHPVLSSCTKVALRRLLHEKEFIEFEEKYPHLSGLDFVEQVLDYFNFSYTISDRELERIPSSGRCVIIANHPIGSLDGMALIKLVSEIRKDFKVVANELLMTVKQMQSLLLPVNNMNGQTARENIKRIQNHLRNEGIIIIFPAGEVSRLKPSGIKDGEWNSGFLKLAQATESPILPIHIKGKNSWSFYFLSMLSKPLSTLFLVTEMFKQQEKSLPIKIGEMIPYENFKGNQLKPKEKVRLFQRHLYRIGKNKKGCFTTESAIAHPEHKQDLQNAIMACEKIGQTSDKKDIYLYKFDGSSPIMREIGRLREISFRAVGEGSGSRRDIDKYDAYYEHLILWDAVDLEIVGAYRLGNTDKIVSEQTQKGLYTHSLFNYEQAMQPYFSQGLELGRSFVQPKYWGRRSLDYLWYGIGAYLGKNPSIRYLFGPVSMSNTMPKAAKDLMVYFYKLYFSSSNDIASSKQPYHLSNDIISELSQAFIGNDYKEDFVTLKSMLANMGVSIPTLYKQYSELCEPGGVEFLDFGVDPDFADCIDGLVLVDITKLKSAKKARYLPDQVSENAA
ncbi:lysophospholipid acyltransferase family protein [Catenovulum maritimum]|uniref:L-ornithine N(alpha)-acyltransferase n=1 Tax=Catenovulum maritimum TaxID=1513271 RepID=A0A0J8GSJ2_9ALTE|nr:GNAT family N-acyltransferase [Catenovulum maritimum]KMT65765.1 acyltransferase [Catenovulum maritimum]